jgi:hypothetical protein
LALAVLMLEVRPFQIPQATPTVTVELLPPLETPEPPLVRIEPPLAPAPPAAKPAPPLAPPTPAPPKLIRLPAPPVAVNPVPTKPLVIQPQPTLIPPTLAPPAPIEAPPPLKPIAVPRQLTAVAAPNLSQPLQVEAPPTLIARTGRHAVCDARDRAGAASVYRDPAPEPGHRPQSRVLARFDQ